ncbi:MAG TPA: DUF1761 domain-containing protein [Candidatus Nanoarchaeia archaeon]|nr:DUF1761 domain-containing protein [Candidatus Nanoarchaeia archaeon]
MVNYIAIMVAAVAAHVLGFLWYGPLFGKKWASMMKFTEKNKEKAKGKGMAKLYVLSFIGSLVTAFVLSLFIGPAFDVVSGMINGAIVAALIWIGFMATKALGGVLWEEKSWKLYFLNVSYDLVSLVAMGVIIGAWA